MKHRNHRHHEHYLLAVQCKKLAEQVQLLQKEIEYLHEQYGERYQNHANTLMFLHNKNAELLNEMNHKQKVFPISGPGPVPGPLLPRPKPPTEGRGFDRDIVTPMPNINIIPHPVPHPIEKPKYFGRPYMYPHTYPYPYTYPYSSPYMNPWLYRDVKLPPQTPQTPQTQPIKKEYVLPPKPPIHPKDFLSDSDSDEEY